MSKYIVTTDEILGCERTWEVEASSFKEAAARVEEQTATKTSERMRDRHITGLRIEGPYADECDGVEDAALSNQDVVSIEPKLRVLVAGDSVMLRGDEKRGAVLWTGGLTDIVRVLWEGEDVPQDVVRDTLQYLWKAAKDGTNEDNEG